MPHPICVYEIRDSIWEFWVLAILGRRRLPNKNTRDAMSNQVYIGIFFFLFVLQANLFQINVSTHARVEHFIGNLLSIQLTMARTCMFYMEICSNIHCHRSRWLLRSKLQISTSCVNKSVPGLIFNHARHVLFKSLYCAAFSCKLMNSINDWFRTSYCVLYLWKFSITMMDLFTVHWQWIIVQRFCRFSSEYKYNN